MKKLAIIMGIILGVGILLVGIGIIVVVANPDKFGGVSEGEIEEKFLVEEQEVTAFVLDVGADAVQLLPSEDGKLSIEYYESKRRYWEYSYSNGKAVFKQKQKGWFWGIDINKRPTIKIYLPETVNETLDIDIGSGSLSSNINLKVNELKVDVGSGALSIVNIEATHCDIDVSSGAIKFSNIIVDTMVVDVSSGVTNLDHCTVETIDIDVSSGTLKIDSLAANTVTASLSSGSMKIGMNGFFDEYRVQGKASSGKITVNRGSEKVASGDDIYCGGGDKLISVSISSGSATVNFAG